MSGFSETLCSVFIPAAGRTGGVISLKGDRPTSICHYLIAMLFSYRPSLPTCLNIRLSDCDECLVGLAHKAVAVFRFGLQIRIASRI